MTDEINRLKKQLDINKNNSNRSLYNIESIKEISNSTAVSIPFKPYSLKSIQANIEDHISIRNMLNNKIELANEYIENEIVFITEELKLLNEKEYDKNNAVFKISNIIINEIGI